MFNLRRWLLRPKYELLEAGANPLDDDALMQRERRSKRRSLWRWFVLAWVVALGISVWWMVAKPGEKNNGGAEIAATLAPGTGGAGGVPGESPTAEGAGGGAATAEPLATETPTPTITPTPTHTPYLNDFWGGGPNTILTITPFGQKVPSPTGPTPSPTGPTPTPTITPTITSTPGTTAPAPSVPIGLRVGSSPTPARGIAPTQAVGPTPIVIIQNKTTRVEVTRVVEVTRAVPYPVTVEITRIVYVEVLVTPTPSAQTSSPSPMFYFYLPMVQQ